jgi:RNA polymerase sigma-70 factor (ECF subfamily)
MPDHPAAQIEAHIPGLRRFARQLLRGDSEGADDLVQDALERALSRWHMRPPRAICAAGFTPSSTIAS